MKIITLKGQNVRICAKNIQIITKTINSMCIHNSFDIMMSMCCVAEISTDVNTNTVFLFLPVEVLNPDYKCTDVFITLMLRGVKVL